MPTEASHDPKQHDKSLDLTIRATNGEPWETDDFRTNTKISHVVQKALAHFVKRGLMADGDYRLARVVDGTAQPPLPDDSQLDDAEVPDHATLTLVPRKPQVDG